MNKTEVKKLLKRRDTLLKAYLDLGNDICYSDSSIFKSGRNDTAKILYDMDKGLLRFVKESAVGEWLLQIKGMTPDIAAGLIAYLDVRGKDCSAQFIKYCGVDNRNNPHNNNVSNIMDRLKDNFKSEPNSLYWKLNEDKFYNELKNSTSIETARIRADRYMKKIFISHLFEEMYLEEYGVLPYRHNDADCIIIEPEVPYTK